MKKTIKCIIKKVNNITYTKHGWHLECDKDIEYGTGGIFLDKMYKETWFLIREEAEQKLKEMESVLGLDVRWW